MEIDLNVIRKVESIRFMAFHIDIKVESNVRFIPVSNIGF